MSSLSFLRRRGSRLDGDGAPGALESFRKASLATRTLVTVVSMLAAFSIVVGVVSVIAISATKAVFPAAEEQQPLASPSATGEAVAPPAKKARAKGDRPE